MAKGWKTIYTNADTTTETRAEKVRKAHHFDKTIRTTETPTIDQLKRINDYNYEIKVAEEEKLLLPKMGRGFHASRSAGG